MSDYGKCPAPSTWVNWCPAADRTVDAFYNSVIVRESHDGTFFMTNGWGAGYLGLQDRTPKWVIFSVWDTDLGKAELVKKGPKTKVDGFDGEGTGGKSWIEFDWELHVRYSACVKARPGPSGTTIYSGYFLHPEDGWVLIAEFKVKHKDGASIKNLGSFTEDWLSHRCNGGVRRTMCLGPALVRYEGDENWYSCEECHGISQDTRQSAGYLNREVQHVPESLLVQTWTGGMEDTQNDLHHGKLQTHIVPSPSIMLSGGEWAGVYSAGGDFINGELYYHCINNEKFIAFDGDCWQLVDVRYLDEITAKQGHFGSLDHSGPGRITEASWADYRVARCL